MDHDLDVLLRLVVAAALTGLLGWERQAKGKAAGLRTHMMVGVGAAMFVALGESMVIFFGEFGSQLQFDPIRIIEAVVAGISFLGAGTIFVSRGGPERVRGLTTAASIWGTAAVGLAVGLGRYVLAAGATTLFLIVLWLLRRFEPHAEADPE